MSSKISDYVPIKSVIREVLDKDKSDNYIKGLSIAYADVKDIYEFGMNYLMNGETTETIKCLIFGLDYDRYYKPLLHLTKTMSYGLSERLFDEDAQSVRRKYDNFDKARKLLSKKIKELKEKVKDANGKVYEANKDLEDIKPQFFSFKRLFILYIFKKRDFENRLERLVRTRNEIQRQLDDLELEVSNIDHLCKIEEYSKILRIILEVCAYPTRFKWALMNKNN
jgi:hypothetical protein